LESENDMDWLLGREPNNHLRQQVTAHREYLARLLAETEASRERVLDLLANARRRRDERRYDDAVARLYRGLEALAQAHLRQDHGIADTGAVPLSAVPESLRSALSAKPDQAGILKLGLRDDYCLLQGLGNPLGRRFFELELQTKKSPLNARNRSI